VTIASVAVPTSEMPDRSPLIVGANTGTQERETPRAITCSETLFGSGSTGDGAVAISKPERQPRQDCLPIPDENFLIGIGTILLPAGWCQTSPIRMIRGFSGRRATHTASCKPFEKNESTPLRSGVDDAGSPSSKTTGFGFTVAKPDERMSRLPTNSLRNVRHTLAIAATHFPGHWIEAEIDLSNAVVIDL